MIGTYQFTATPRKIGCPFGEVPDGGFTFEGTFSRNPDRGEVWLTLNGVSRDAGFDGVVLTSAFAAPRSFAECQGGDGGVGDGGVCEGGILDEVLRVAMLSRSQLAQLNDACPANPFDGGIPAPDDAGIEAPGPRGADGGGFDAPRVCGELIDRFTPVGAACQCGACEMEFDVSGVRR